MNGIQLNEFETSINKNKCKVKIEYINHEKYSFESLDMNRISFIFQEDIAIDLLDYYLKTIKNIFTFFFVTQEIKYEGILVSNKAGMFAQYICDEIIPEKCMANKWLVRLLFHILMYVE